ncbi:MAG: alpha/beta hydrolase [Flavobacterium sp.]|nr:MAG: alpha/beta hydrolase [Flavobacterium sp.]
MLKPRLLILSDLFGGENPNWLHYYTEILEPNFDIQYYDVLQLAGILSDGNETNIHNLFINGGIDNAVDTLLFQEKEKVSVLGFSVGGTIAWKAALKGLKTDRLIAVSSTRLRFETEVPDCKIKLYFGENDFNAPNLKWFSALKISYEFLKDQHHQMYSEQKNAVFICKNI